MRGAATTATGPGLSLAPLSFAAGGGGGAAAATAAAAARCPAAPHEIGRAHV